MERLLADAGKMSGQKYDINNLADVYKAIQVIQDDLGITGTTAKEAASTLEGSFNSMKASATNLLGNLALGKDVGPSMKALASSASTFLFDNLMPALGNIFSNLPAAIGTFMQTGLPKLGAGVQNLIANLMTYFSNNRGQIMATISSLATSAAAFLQANIPKFMMAALRIGAKIAVGLAKSLPTILAAIGRIVAGVGRGLLSGLGRVVTAALTAVKAKIAAVWAGIKEKLTHPIQAAKDKIKSIIDRVKGFFPLSIGKIFSGLKLPHISVDGGKAPFGIGGKGSLPSFGVSWYAKAANTPYMFNDATLFGAGETSDEMLYGHARLMGDISTAVSPVGAKLDALAAAMSGTSSPQSITIPVYLDSEKIGESTVEYINGQVAIYGASPLAI